jgi:hypothetical protein
LVELGVRGMDAAFQRHQNSGRKKDWQRIIRSRRTRPRTKPEDFARTPLTACAVITVMPASIVMMPNPRTVDDWPEYWDRGIHYVRPPNFGRMIALVVVAVAVGAAIPLQRNKMAKQ